MHQIIHPTITGTSLSLVDDSSVTEVKRARLAQARAVGDRTVWCSDPGAADRTFTAYIRSTATRQARRRLRDADDAVARDRTRRPLEAHVHCLVRSLGER